MHLSSAIPWGDLGQALVNVGIYEGFAKENALGSDNEKELICHSSSCTTGKTGDFAYNYYLTEYQHLA